MKSYTYLYRPNKLARLFINFEDRKDQEVRFALNYLGEIKIKKGRYTVTPLPVQIKKKN